MHNSIVQFPPRSSRVIGFARALAASLFLSSVILPVVAGAQGRYEERHGFDEGEGRILGFYSAAVTFTPGQAPRSLEEGALSLGFELGFIPHLSPSQRRVGDKPESSNLVPVFPRPRLAMGLGAGFVLEGSWIPPVKFFDVKANIGSVALSRSFSPGSRLRITPRIAGSIGSVEGTVTCDDDMAEGGIDLLVYWAEVCGLRESRDRFLPRHLLGELVGSWESASALIPYAGLGIRGDWSRFEVNVIRADGSIDPDHPILTMQYARPYGLAGVTWKATSRVRTTVELLAAPGSLFTARVMGSFDAR